MEKKKMLFLARFVECQMETEVNNVLNDSIEDPHFSAVYTANLICVCSELLAELNDKPLPYTTVKEYFNYLGCTHQEYELFEKKRKKEAEYYIGDQFN